MWQKFLLARKKNGQIQGMISRRRLILPYTIQQVIPKICTTFQNPRFTSSCEIFDEKKRFTYKHTHTNIVTEKTKTIYQLYTSYTGGIIIGYKLQHFFWMPKFIAFLLYSWLFYCILGYFTVFLVIFLITTDSKISFWLLAFDYNLSSR